MASHITLSKNRHKLRQMATPLYKIIGPKIYGIIAESVRLEVEESVEAAQIYTTEQIKRLRGEIADVLLKRAGNRLPTVKRKLGKGSRRIVGAFAKARKCLDEGDYVKSIQESRRVIDSHRDVRSRPDAEKGTATRAT